MKIINPLALAAWGLKPKPYQRQVVTCLNERLNIGLKFVNFMI